MKKNVLKLISAICIATGIMSLGTIKANAANYNYDMGDIMEYPYSTTFEIESWQWFQRANGTWGALSPDGHQGLANSWIHYNNKWYFIDDKSNMVENAVVCGQDGNLYYMQEDGSMLTNGYCTYQFYGSRRVGGSTTKFYADANGVLTIIGYIN